VYRGVRRGSRFTAEDVRIIARDLLPVLRVAESDDNVTQVLHRLHFGSVTSTALGVVLVRAVYVDGRFVADSVEEVGARSGLWGAILLLPLWRRA